LFLFLWLDLDIEKKNGYWCSILDSNVNTWDKGEKRVYYFPPIRSLNITIVSCSKKYHNSVKVLLF
jgi:hypothetical protein